MDFRPLIPGDRQVIESYGGGGFRVSGTRYAGSLIVFPERTLAWSVTAMAELDVATLRPVVDRAVADGAVGGGAVEILLVGCGLQNSFIDPELRAALKADGIALDGMDTGAACRTYNVLLGEGRNVAAALIAI